VAPLLAALPPRLREKGAKPEPLHYRVIYMERDMEEVLQSQGTMLQRLGKSPGQGGQAADIGKAFRQQERHAKGWCAASGIHALAVDYEALVHRPDEILPKIAGFLGAPDRISAMRSCIDPELHRARRTG
jgi:hypothetical protein